jgi:hypothetical protein
MIELQMTIAVQAYTRDAEIYLKSWMRLAPVNVFVQNANLFFRKGFVDDFLNL